MNIGFVRYALSGRYEIANVCYSRAQCKFWFKSVWKIIIGLLKYRIMYHLGLKIYFFYTYEKIFFSRITKMNMLSLFQNVWLLIKYFHWRTEIHKCLSTEWQKSKIAFSLKYRNPKVPFHWITEIQKYLSTELQKS